MQPLNTNTHVGGCKETHGHVRTCMFLCAFCFLSRLIRNSKSSKRHVLFVSIVAVFVLFVCSVYVYIHTHTHM